MLLSYDFWKEGQATPVPASVVPSGPHGPLQRPQAADTGFWGGLGAAGGGGLFFTVCLLPLVTWSKNQHSCHQQTSNPDLREETRSEPRCPLWAAGAVEGTQGASHPQGLSFTPGPVPTLAPAGPTSSHSRERDCLRGSGRRADYALLPSGNISHYCTAGIQVCQPDPTRGLSLRPRKFPTPE